LYIRMVENRRTGTMRTMIAVLITVVCNE